MNHELQNTLYGLTWVSGNAALEAQPSYRIASIWVKFTLMGWVSLCLQVKGWNSVKRLMRYVYRSVLWRGLVATDALHRRWRRPPPPTTPAPGHSPTRGCAPDGNGGRREHPIPRRRRRGLRLSTPPSKRITQSMAGRPWLVWTWTVGKLGISDHSFLVSRGLLLRANILNYCLRAIWR